MPTPACILSRPIELTRILEGGTWDNVFVDIPATTHDSQIAEVAIAKAKVDYGDLLYCVYNTMDDDVPEVEGAFVIEVQDDARCVQRFLVQGAEDEEDALEKLGTGDREQYGPDEVLSWLGANDDEYKVVPFG